MIKYGNYNGWISDIETKNRIQMILRFLKLFTWNGFHVDKNNNYSRTCLTHGVKIDATKYSIWRMKSKLSDKFFLYSSTNVLISCLLKCCHIFLPWGFLRPVHCTRSQNCCTIIAKNLSQYFYEPCQQTAWASVFWRCLPPSMILTSLADPNLAKVLSVKFCFLSMAISV